MSAVVAVLLAAGLGCSPRTPTESKPRPRHGAVDDSGRWNRTAIGFAFEGKPWISHVTTIDFDGDGMDDILACDDQLLAITWIRQSAPGKFEESILVDELPAPVHVEAVDMDGDDDLDLLLACMGEVFPNNEPIGSVILMENLGGLQFRRHVLAERIARVTDVQAGDFDGDGRLDLAVGQFGYHQGEIRWMRNLGDWKFESEILSRLSGTIHVCVADFNNDQALDFVALVSQQWEEIHLFEGDGRGNFTSRILFGSTNEDYGSSGMSLADLNGDGRIDILYTNGDGFAYADPGTRPWHGVQWLENLGTGFFRFHRIATVPGAYSPVGVDLNRDGAMDIVVSSGFNDWENPAAAALLVLMNDGTMGFTQHVIARDPTQLLSCDVGDFDGTGRPSIVAAGFYSYPPYDRMGRIMLWRRSEVP